MSSTAAADATQASNSASKKKNNKKKKGANKNKDLTGTDDARKEVEDGDDEPETPTQDTSQEGQADSQDNASPSNGHVVPPSTTTDGDRVGSDTTAKLEVMGKEREALRAEVEQLRKQLERIQEHHATETSELRTEVEESNAAKEAAEEQYQNLLGRVGQIKETLSGRLKRDREELEEAKERIEELEAQNEELRGSAESTGTDVAKLKEELADATRELTTLRSRNNLSAQNWQKERDEMAKTVQTLKQELDTTSNAMGEWEVIAMEERSVKESLQDKMADLEEQVVVLRTNYESTAEERESQSTLVNNLQNALREIQDARKAELRDVIESTDQQLGAQKKLLQEAEARAAEAVQAKEKLTAELERTAPYEKEVKEKNLLIGKLRHEAIVLNDHLTKALRYLKKTKPEDNVDRQIVTNHLLHFLTLDRGDPKRFQVLQVMAGYLNWTDEQREQAGLARPGASSGSLRLPMSPFHRTPSSPSLSAEVFSEPSGSRDKETLAELWASFLERSALEGREAMSPAIGSLSSPHIGNIASPKMGSIASPNIGSIASPNMGSISQFGFTRPDSRAGKK
ncbi:unnamed protein product [Clonostachys rosea]|uniref:GRIP domain-containing protein n=1 Tax=Bionectria ochroleuca TaxID=29856 RepID=A0ABY6UQ47_BIOOC|nr:unnamed protein product [Clonostachys rosea]